MSIGRGCYEGISEPSELETIADSQGVRYIVCLRYEDVAGKDVWNMYKLSALIYDRETQSNLYISNKGSDIAVEEWENQ